MLSSIVLTSGVAFAHTPVIYITGPSEDWCSVINGVLGGDIVMLEGGNYSGPCDIVAPVPDISGEQTTVQSLDPIDPAVFTGSATDHVLGVSGDRLMLQQLEFEGVPAGIDAVRVVAPTETLELRFDVFRSMEGTPLAVRADVADLRVSDTELQGVEARLVAGCVDGGCTMGNVSVVDNLLVDSAGLTIGRWGAGEVRDNTVYNASGPALRLATSGAGELLVERNLFSGSVAAMQLDGGPAVVRNNVAFGSPSLESTDPDVSNVQVVGNTLIGGSEGVDLTGWGPSRGLRFLSNALDGDLPDLGDVEAAGNLGCTTLSACFTDAAAGDVYPPAGSPLRQAGVDDAALIGDWCGKARGAPPTVGAIEAFGGTSMGPLTAVFHDDFDCTLPDDPTGTSTPPETGDTGAEPTSDPTDPGDTAGGDRAVKDPGCGCAIEASPSAAWLVVLALLGASARERRRRVAALTAVLFAGGLSPRAEAHEATIWILTPADDYCDFLATGITGGDVIKLSPGVYPGPCVITGIEPPEPGEITIVESLDPLDPAVIAGDGVAPYVLALEGLRVWVNGVVLEGASPDGALVEVRDGDLLQLRYATLRSDGHGVRVVGSPSQVWVTDSHFEVAGTGFDVGCDDGTCGPDGLQLRDNWIAAADVGIEVRSGTGFIYDNVVVADTEGLRLSGEIDVRSNWSVSPVSLHLTGPGPTTATNLLQGAVQVDDAQVALWANTLVGDLDAPSGADLRSNLVAGAVPEGLLDTGGNVVCDAMTTCWVDAAGADFRPAEADGQGVAITNVEEDFCGVELGIAPPPGAFAPADEPWNLVVGFKKDQACGLPSLGRPDPTDSANTAATPGTTGNATEPYDSPEAAGCGCTGVAHSPSLRAWLVNFARRRGT